MKNQIPNNQHFFKFKKILFLFLFIMISFVGNSQNLLQTDMTPDGVLDNVLDQHGNQYKLKDILINTDSSGSPANKTVLISCSSSSLFNLYFEDGSGMETVANATQNNINTLRREVLCKVFQDLAAFLTTSNTPQINASTKNKYLGSEY